MHGKSIQIEWVFCKYWGDTDIEDSKNMVLANIPNEPDIEV